MLDSDRQQYLLRTIEMLTKVLADDTKTAQKLWEQRAGFSSGHTGTGSVDAGAVPIDDQAEREFRDYEKRIREIHAAATKLDGMRMRAVGGAYVKPGKEADRGCEIINAYAPGKFEPSEYDATDVGGRLTRKYRLGRWAYDFVVNVGEPDVPDDSNLPTRDEVERHVRGQRVRRHAKRRTRAS